MGGYSGTAVAAHTPIVKFNGQSFAVSAPQRRLIEKAIRAGGSAYVKGAQVRTARVLTLFGELRDEGALSADGEGNPDGERWVFTLKEGVTLV
jgi:hypothetical protein